MSQPNDKHAFTHNDKPLSYTSFSQLCNEAIRDKLSSSSEQKYFTVLEIVQENELDYDSLKLFSRLVSNLLRAGAKDLIDLILTKPPKYVPSSAHHFIKSFEAYQEFCFNLLSFDCSYIIKVTNYILNEALKLCTMSVSDVICLRVGEHHHFDSIEDIQKKARNILQGTKKKELTQITNAKDEDFLSELFKTHPNAREKGIKGMGKTIKVFKGRSKQNTPCFFISLTSDQDTVRSTPSHDNNISELEDISYMKCINEVAVKLSHNMIKAMRDLRLDVRMFIDLAVTIADRFPFNKPKILNLILKMIPHSALHVQVHAIYTKILFYILKKMPYYEEEILEALLTRFIQIDVNIKSKQLANKRHFTSQDLKADVYLFYLIQHFKNRLNVIEEESIPSIKKPDLTNSANVRMAADSDDDSILESSDEEETYEDSVAAKNKLDKFCDMLIRLFENNVLPYSESHYPQYCFLYVCSINQMFLQKLITLFILRAFNNNDVSATNSNFRNDGVHNKVCNINYLCSILATSGKEILSTKIFLDSIRFLVKFFKKKFHSKKIMVDRLETYSSNSECSEMLHKRGKKTIRVDDKLFYISVIQGLSYILTFKIPELESQDPTLLTKILKLVLNNEYKAAMFNQTSLLKMLLESMKTHRVASKYVRRLMKLIKDQKNFLRYKKDLFNRIKRKMPFGTPLFLIESGVFFENIHSHLPNNQIQESISRTLIPPENKRNFLQKKGVAEEEEKVSRAPKHTTFEDKKLNAAMLAAFGVPVNRTQEKDIRQTIFGKLGRSLSMDYKHKQKAVCSNQNSQEVFRKPLPKDVAQTLQIEGNIKYTEGHFDLTENALEQFENLSDGYASGKETDVASIDLFDKVRPWTVRRKNRSRNINRRANRMKNNLVAN
jgi:hypothetical protein